MDTKAELIRTASMLYKVGAMVEGARQKLKALVEAGVPYESSEMKEALETFRRLDSQWKQTEKEYLALRKRALDKE